VSDLVILEELGFAIRATVGEYHVDYVIYEVFRKGDGEGFYFQEKEAICHPSPIEGEQNAEVWAHGSVKWDGCSNWHFDCQDKVFLHACEREEILNWSAVLVACRDMTAKILPNWDG
jgi:hypothetical protein